MFEKVNPKHPDKIADRIAGAIVDQAYKQESDPKIAVEVLIGHGRCLIIAETSTKIDRFFVNKTVDRIVGSDVLVGYVEVEQDKELARNQSQELRAGDNGIFKGVPTSDLEKTLSRLAHKIYDEFDSDGKYILNYDSGYNYIICQSNASHDRIRNILDGYTFNTIKINPLGDWTGGINVDTGATNRKLGSDMGRAVTGGGLHGKDLSKADVSVNIYAHLKAQELGKPVELSCAIGDKYIDGKPYYEIVDIARNYIEKIGGFEKLAEWGLI